MLSFSFLGHLLPEMVHQRHLLLAGGHLFPTLDIFYQLVVRKTSFTSRWCKFDIPTGKGCLHLAWPIKRMLHTAFTVIVLAGSHKQYLQVLKGRGGGKNFRMSFLAKLSSFLKFFPFYLNIYGWSRNIAAKRAKSEISETCKWIL